MSRREASQSPRPCCRPRWHPGGGARRSVPRSAEGSARKRGKSAPPARARRGRTQRASPGEARHALAHNPPASARGPAPGAARRTATCRRTLCPCRGRRRRRARLSSEGHRGCEHLPAAPGRHWSRHGGGWTGPAATNTRSQCGRTPPTRPPSSRSSRPAACSPPPRPRRRGIARPRARKSRGAQASHRSSGAVRGCRPCPGATRRGSWRPRPGPSSATRAHRRRPRIAPDAA
mmetsp:Transcript_157705/g.505785  ORF Transcript_157705/g.505785 Transcript_157705/m.505785 type:complete len:233 (-) Transcript_157705:299-997(-)